MVHITGFWAAVILLTLIAALLSWLTLTLAAFREHVLWGAVVVLAPFGTLVFAIVHWDRVARSFLALHVLGVVLFVEVLLTSMVAGLAG